MTCPHDHLVNETSWDADGEPVSWWRCAQCNGTYERPPLPGDATIRVVIKGVCLHSFEYKTDREMTGQEAIDAWMKTSCSKCGEPMVTPVTADPKPPEPFMTIRRVRD